MIRSWSKCYKRKKKTFTGRVNSRSGCSCFRQDRGQGKPSLGKKQKTCETSSERWEGAPLGRSPWSSHSVLPPPSYHGPVYVSLGFLWGSPQRSRASCIFLCIFPTALERCLANAACINKCLSKRAFRWHLFPEREHDGMWGKEGTCLFLWRVVCEFCNHFHDTGESRLSLNIQSISIETPSEHFNISNYSSKDFFIQQIKGTYILGCFSVTLGEILYIEYI